MSLVRRMVRRRVDRKLESAGRRVESKIRSSLLHADDQFHMAEKFRKFVDHIFPDHWSFMIGEIALYSFVALIATGVFLALYFNPSYGDVVYNGPYKPLNGVHVSEAFLSTMRLSFSVRFGLVVRQTHHWAADIFIGAIVVHCARIFFTGAYRKPRHLNWYIGSTMLFVAIVEGFCGYSMPDDLMSGQGLRIGYSIVESIPVVGEYIAVWLFHGQFPGNGVIEQRLYLAHVFLLPGIIAVLLVVHLGLIFLQKHTQLPQPHRKENNVVGTPLYPGFSMKSGGLSLMVIGFLVFLGGIAQINPIWQFGPYSPSHGAMGPDATQPDWYMGWIEGAMREMKNWEFLWGHYTFAMALFIPAVVLPVLTYVAMLLWPNIEARLTADVKDHELCVRPRDRPRLTGIGVGVFTFYGMTLLAGSDDLLSDTFQIKLQTMLWLLRGGTILLPFVFGYTAYRICLNLREPSWSGTAAHVELHDGAYVALPVVEEQEEEPEPIPVPVMIRSDGASTWTSRSRAAP